MGWEGEIRGQMLINIYETNGLVITHTCFKKPKRRPYAWKTPGDSSCHKMDYILERHRFRNSMKDVQTMPVADNDF
jgi:hypothetical protein